MPVVPHVARRLRRVARPAARDDDELRAVGGPLKAGDAVGGARQPPRLAAAERQQPHLRARVVVARRGTRREERNRAAVGAPARARRRAHRIGERLRLARSVSRRRIDRAAAAILFLIDRRHHVRDRRSVRRDARIAERLEHEVVLGRDAARLRGRSIGKRDQRERGERTGQQCFHMHPPRTFSAEAPPAGLSAASRRRRRSDPPPRRWSTRPSCRGRSRSPTA